MPSRQSARLAHIEIALRMVAHAVAGHDPESLRRALDWARTMVRNVEGWVAHEALSQWPADEASEKVGEPKRTLYRWRNRKAE